MILRLFIRKGIAFLGLGILPAQPLFAQDAANIEKGKAVYDSYCVICHGEKGDGKGLMGIIHRAQQKGFVVAIYPRDFTAGVFKFRSTPTGELPTDEDLLRTVRQGIPRSGMPSHKDLSEAEIEAVVEYIKTFSLRWQEEELGTPIEISDVPADIGSSPSVERGKKVYDLMKCWECHGETGRGDGPAAGQLKDDWGDRILPFDFTSGALKGGTGKQDLLKTFVTGLDGTPMPSYYETLSLKQSWDLVSYCLHLMKGGKDETALK
jgi:mono/diheme cytochrome c family protein